MINKFNTEQTGIGFEFNIELEEKYSEFKKTILKYKTKEKENARTTEL